VIMSRSYGLLSEIANVLPNSAHHALADRRPHRPARTLKRNMSLSQERADSFVFIWWDWSRCGPAGGPWIRSGTTIETKQDRGRAREEPARRVRHHAAVRQIKQIEKTVTGNNDHQLE